MSGHEKEEGWLSSIQFGDNKLGRIAEAGIKEGRLCQECGARPAEGTLDFDVWGQADQVFVCGNCVETVRRKVSADLKNAGTGDLVNTWGYNGNGRY